VKDLKLVFSAKRGKHSALNKCSSNCSNNALIIIIDEDLYTWDRSEIDLKGYTVFVLWCSQCTHQIRGIFSLSKIPQVVSGPCYGASGFGWLLLQSSFKACQSQILCQTLQERPVHPPKCQPEPSGTWPKRKEEQGIEARKS